MQIINTIAEMSRVAAGLRKAGKRIGFVPTMGALHSGHLSLLELARRNADVSIMSIYVNPAQFGPNEDFSKYPRPFDADAEMARSAGCDILFAPSNTEMYPVNYNTYVDVEKITAGLCGASRPGHFRGVATIVLKFFNIVQPDCAVFGRKDAQQVLVIKRMIMDLNLRVTLIVAPTFRESDGLAMSSRNVYLAPQERMAAPLLHSGLSQAADAYDRGERDAGILKRFVTDSMGSSPLLAREYVELVDIETVHSIDTVSGCALLALACRTTQSRTRLIDNITLGGEL